jgi:hypothetical protein
VWSTTTALAIVSLRSGDAAKSLALVVSAVSNKMTTSFKSSDERKTRGFVRLRTSALPMLVEPRTPYTVISQLMRMISIPMRLLSRQQDLGTAQIQDVSAVYKVKKAANGSVKPAE